MIDGVAGCDAVELAGARPRSRATSSSRTTTRPRRSTWRSWAASAGDLTITGNDAAGAISLGELDSVAGDLTITDNGDATVALGSPDQVAGDLTLDTTGSGILDIGVGSPSGDLDLDTVGYGGVTGATAGGSTTIETEHPEALMRAVLPAGAFSAPVPFSITRLDPAALPPEGSVDPVVAYTFEFGVPTLNSPAELSFAIRLGALDAATRDALLAALADGRATLATKGDGAYQAFPVCAAGAAPAAGRLRAGRAARATSCASPAWSATSPPGPSRSSPSRRRRARRRPPRPARRRRRPSPRSAPGRW